MTSATLSPSQLQALLDILVHHETYAEVQSFRDPEAIDRYGYPFIDSATAKQGSKHERKFGIALRALVAANFLSGSLVSTLLYSIASLFKRHLISKMLAMAGFFDNQSHFAKVQLHRQVGKRPC